jgi:hypothetical protein
VRAVALVLVTLAGGLLAVAGAAVTVGWRRRRRRAVVARRRAPSAAAPLLAAFDRLEVALRRAGRERREWETLTDLAARLEDPPGEGGAIEAALGVLERALYGPLPPRAEPARAAAEVLDRVAARLLADSRGREADLSRPGPGG